MLQIILFSIHQQAFLVQLFSSSSSEDQFICAVKGSDKFMDAQNPPAGIERALSFGFKACVSIDRLLPLPAVLRGCPRVLRLRGQLCFLCSPQKAAQCCLFSLQLQDSLCKHRYRDAEKAPCLPVFSCDMRYLLFSMDELHLHLSLEETENLVHGAQGRIAKTSHRWGRSSCQPKNSRFSENTVRNPVSATWAVQRSACEIAGSYQECGSPLCLLHTLYCSCLWSNRTSLTWMKLCREIPWLRSAMLALERTSSRNVLASAAWPWLCFNVLSVQVLKVPKAASAFLLW